MKIFKSFVVLLAILLFTSSISFAELGVVTNPSPINKLRFTIEGEYLASFSAVAKGVDINYKKVKDLLSSHLSREIGKDVQGLIWENSVEDCEEITFYLYFNKRYIGNVKIAVKYFQKDNDFIYDMGGLREALKSSLSKDVAIVSIRKKGDNRAPDFDLDIYGTLVYHL